MVVEHEFVTTLTPAEAMARITHFLAFGGFSLARPDFRDDQPVANTLEMTRGHTRAKNTAKLPQRVIATFDRGRINLAIAIAPQSVWGHRFGAATVITPRTQQHHDLLMCIAVGVETAVNAPTLNMHAPWKELEGRLHAAALRRGNKHLILLSIIIAVVTFLSILIASTALR